MIYGVTGMWGANLRKLILDKKKKEYFFSLN